LVVFDEAAKGAAARERKGFSQQGDKTMESFWNDILSFFKNIWAEIAGFFHGLFGGNED
jgi:hypothetical protein